jgi:purine-nucleoside phosphorylase
MSIPLYEQALEASRYILARAGNIVPRVALVLGSGLAGVAEAVTDSTEIGYSDIPHFVGSTVEGHEGKLIVGLLGGVSALIMKGRFHFYEGYSMEEVTLPIRVFAVLGIQSLVLTNAAGGISSHLSPGDLMLITDHINLMGDNPLRGPNEKRFGPRFPDMTEVYAPSLRDLARQTAKEAGITLSEGVYAAVRGPMYETPAEIRMLAAVGADAVGMSTVPEAIVARHGRMSVLAVSCITNSAAGLVSKEVNHNEVIEVGARAAADLSKLLVSLAPKLPLISEPTP